LDERVDGLAQIGLRTLVISQRVLTPSELNNFNNKYNEAARSMDMREEKK
jgi:hypothetical protein